MQSTIAKPQVSHYFPRLPQELRDNIWRECLPWRIVEIDDYLARYSLNGPLDDDSDHDHQAQPPTACFMRSTSKLNASPPIITRVCRESRRVALRTGGFMDRPFPTGPPHGWKSRKMRNWFDKERDIVHVHWNALINRLWGAHPASEHLVHFESNLSAARAGCSINQTLLSPSGHSTPWMRHRAVLERIGRVAVCFETVCIHAPEGAAIASGLFGMLGEERIILVDALDYDRLGKLWALWDAHREEHPDPLTFDFFSECYAQAAGSEAQRRRTQTIHDAVECIQKRWVLDNWDEQDELPGWSERQHVWLATPDWVSTRDYIKKGRQRHRRDYMSMWVPKRDHPWMIQVYSRMPEFRPVIMFRLCTDTYYLQQGTTRGNRLGRWDDQWRIKCSGNSIPPWRKQWT
ncbi:hypothetical protein N0V93_010038 [Gnomoniopsis smithogilvyi]|uniref:2EXR domain-containing protein n=1 Tax=Gnomoniopsis smithogilvyi TaxID=1191159 RepID=A0A9W8YIY3_9PEZI|nr:hypothetical protein N0V93_010038 [Gnomoniopsis smithogilvyi]